MNKLSHTCAAVALALLCVGSAGAQGRWPDRCPPGNPHCQGSNSRSGQGDRHQSPPMQMQEQGRNDHRAWPQQGRDDRRGWHDSGRDAGRETWSARDHRRGERVPPGYRSKQYVVDNWSAHGLRRPPRGYQWVQNGSDYVLVAITTGIILELLLSH